MSRENGPQYVIDLDPVFDNPQQTGLQPDLDFKNPQLTAGEQPAQITQEAQTHLEDNTNYDDMHLLEVASKVAEVQSTNPASPQIAQLYDVLSKKIDHTISRNRVTDPTEVGRFHDTVNNYVRTKKEEFDAAKAAPEALAEAEAKEEATSHEKPAQRFSAVDVDGILGFRVNEDVSLHATAYEPEPTTQRELYFRDDKGNTYAIVRARTIDSSDSAPSFGEEDWVVINGNASEQSDGLALERISNNSMISTKIALNQPFHPEFMRQGVGKVTEIIGLDVNDKPDLDELAQWSEGRTSDIRSKFWEQVGRDAPKPKGAVNKDAVDGFAETIVDQPVPTAVPDPEAHTDAERERDEIFESMGLENLLRPDRIPMMENGKLIAGPQLLDAYRDADGRIMIKLKIKEGQADGSFEMVEEEMTQSQLLNFLAQSDKNWQSRRKRPNTLPDSHEDQLYEDAARLRDDLRRQLTRELGDDGSEKRRRPSLRNLRQRASRLVASLVVNRFMNQAQAATPGESNKKWTTKEKLVAAGLGIAVLAATYATYRGYMDHDTASQLSGGGTDADSGGNSVGDHIQEAAQQADAPDSDPSSAGSDGSQEATQAWTDKVESGDGPTHTMSDYLSAHGIEVTPTQSYEVFEKARNAGLLTPEHMTNISPQDVQGGVGFNGPGKTTLSPELVEFLNKEFDIK